MTLTDSNTIGEAKQYLKENWRKKDGTHCPCCTRRVYLAPTPFHSTMAYTLILFYEHAVKNGDEAWLDINALIASKGQKSKNDYTKLGYWGLIESKKGERADGSKRVGIWRITQKGKLFARGEIEVPKRGHFFNQKVWSWSEEQTDIVSALGKRFNYRELMGGSLEDLGEASLQQPLIKI